MTDSTVEQGISYLRVSSKRQMDTAADVDPDGNSIATQREYTEAKAKAMRVVVAREFIEPGTSAQSIEKRPVFGNLLKYLQEHPDIRYVFIYMRSRAFRNFTDAAITKRQLDKMGVKLISAKEDFGEGIMADAMEAVTDIMNEVQVRLSGQDISVKMLHKAQNGGTNGKAKLGYLNGVKYVDGRRVNTVIVDEERAKYIPMAFELMATGRYANVEQLRDKLTDAGLRMPGSGQPISVQTIWKLLRDRYYVGAVIYKGMEYSGRHTALISEELFERVQRVLDSHSGSGTRQRTHFHYLKGVIWCARCKQRFMVQRTKNRHDPAGEYYYFFCGGREDKTCDQPYISVEAMEQAVEAHYGDPASVWLPEDFRAQVRTVVDEAVASNHELTDDMREQFARRLTKLDAKESYLLDLAAEEGWPKDTLRAKVTTIRQERQSIQRQLGQAERQLDTGRGVFDQALALLDDPHALYRRGNETVRDILNRAFFTKLYVDGRKARVVDHELREPFDLLSEAYRLYQDHRQGRRVYHRRTVIQTPNSAAHDDVTGAADDREGLVASLVMTLASQVSSSAVMVELRGFEPLTPTLPVWCATSCATAPCGSG
jgi:site-specific DNA recombinase